MQTICKKGPFKENGKLLKLFCLIMRGLNLPVGSDTLQNKILRGIRPCRTRSCKVTDPAKQVLWGIRPRRTMTEMCKFYSRPLLCGVWYPAEHRLAGADTPPNKILRGIRPRGTKFCGVSQYHTLGINFKYEYYREFKNEFKNILGCEFGDFMGSIHGKN